MAEQPPSCHLLALPAELRNQIWEELLVQKQQQQQRGNSNCRFCANVLRTCKQIHTEGSPILYGENTFLAHSNLLTALPSFLLATQPSRIKLPPVIHPRVTALIRKYYIHIRLDTDPRFSKTQATESFSEIESLEMEVFQAMYGSSDFAVLKLFESVRGVGSVRIRGSVGDGNYARWLEQSMKAPVGSEVAPYYEQYVGGMPGWDAWTNGNR